MSKIVPVKNIDPFLVDIKRPNGDYKYFRKVVNLSGFSSSPFVIYRHRRSNFKFIIVLFLIFFLSGFLFWSTFNLKKLASSIEADARSVINNFLISFNSLRDFKPNQAFFYLQKNEKLLANLNEILSYYTNQKIIEVTSKLIPEIKEGEELIKEIYILNQIALEATKVLDDLRLNAFYYFQNNGQALISQLEKLHNILNELVSKSESIQKKTTILRNLSPVFNEIGVLINTHYFSHQPDLHRWNKFLASLLEILNRKSDIHLLLLFQNPSEIRPSGGFIGSYADVVIRRGQLYLIDVRDIYDADGQLDLLVVPPQPLQVTNYVWSARDANWFFDFPTSATKVIYFLEKSKLYQEQKVTFDIAIAINIDVFKSILNITGPIELENNLIITEDNVVKELRQEIEKAKAEKKPYPKQILRRLTPIVIEKMKNFDSLQKEKLIENIFKNIEEKDIMFFAKDKSLQSFFVVQKIAGAVSFLSRNFVGNYLAVVNANIEGGKSDAFVSQEIDLEVIIDSQGGSLNNLVVRRTHFGDKEKELWWRKQNQNYIQIFTNPGAAFVNIKGNNNPPPKFREVDYESEGYQADPDVVKIEKSNVFLSNYKTWVGQAFGKTVFGTWFIVPPGKTKELELRYQLPPPVTGGIEPMSNYEFIYEKQSGVDTRLKLSIYAPVGYKFQESDSSIFNFNNEIKESRFILKLTFVPSN